MRYQTSLQHNQNLDTIRNRSCSDSFVDSGAKQIALILAIIAIGFHGATAQTSISAIRPTSRVFILPTANAIGAGHGFIGDYELFFLYGGVGIGDVVSVTAGSTLLPGLALSSQLLTAQMKFTLVQDEGFAMAVGGSVASVTTANQYTHLFLNASLLYDSTWYTVMAFYKMGGPDQAAVDVSPYGNFAFFYTGGLGIALGAEIAIRNHPDMHIIGELWNHDVSNPRHTGIFAGLRIGNDVFSGAFGLAFTPVPFVFPLAHFTYEW